MKIANIQSIAIATAARAKPIAAPAPSSIAFTALSAKGWFWKSVTLWIHRPGDATDTALATFTYQPTNLFNEGTGKTDGPFGAQIPLGTNYDKLYLTMTVRDNGCGPGYKPRHPGAMQGSTYYWDPYECVAGQSTPAVVPYTFSTNDPATSDHLFVNGVRLATGVSVSFDKLAKCNESVIHSWEDTKVYKAGDQAWATQDFVFKVAVSSCAANSAASASSGARLIE